MKCGRDGGVGQRFDGPAANVHIRFSIGEREYSIKLDDCIHADRGWFLGDTIEGPEAR